MLMYSIKGIGVIWRNVVSGIEWVFAKYVWKHASVGRFWLLPIHETLWRTYWIVARWIRYNQNSALAHTVIVAITFRHLSIEFQSMRRRAIRDERQEATDETFRNKIKNSFRRDSKEDARDDFVSRRIFSFTACRFPRGLRNRRRA